MPSPMIQLKNVSKWYGPVQVLNNCSVEVAQGDVVVVDESYGIRLTKLVDPQDRINSL